MTIVNTHQAEAWNGYEGKHWADHHDRYDAVNSGFNDYLLQSVRAGDRVLDVGCGNGQVSRLAARRAGHVPSVSCSIESIPPPRRALVLCSSTLFALTGRLMPYGCAAPPT